MLAEIHDRGYALTTMLTIISGTNRPGSNTRKVAQQVTELYADQGEKLDMVDLAFLPPEIFNPLSYSQKPAAFQPFAEKVVNSEGLIVVTPEYNGSFPGVLKYFIDMLPFPESFENKPVCFIGLAAGMWGALRSVEQLQAIWGYRNGYIFPQRVFIPKVNSVLGKDGKLTDEAIVDMLKKQAKGFSQFARSVK